MRHFITHFAVVTFLTLLSSSAYATIEGVLTLVQEGQPRATILLAEHPRQSAQLAAFELQHYIKKISGATLAIVREPTEVTGTRIIVGESNATLTLGIANKDFQKQEYLIKTFANALVLMGYDHDEVTELDYADYRSLYDAVSGPIGTCYAVHAFLENTLGVHWYYPNEQIGEVVPTSATVSVDNLDIRRSPDAPIRNVYPLFTNTEQLYFTDWDQRQNFKSSWINARTSLLYWIRNRMWASMPYNANHSFHGYDKVFGQSHPEWFSTKSYARMQQLDYQMGIQPCLTQPGFLEQVVQIARDYYDGKEPANPYLVHSTSGDFFPVVLNDNTNMCGCDTCVAQYTSEFGPTGNASRYYWRFLNRVAKEVRKTHPDAMISGLAYFNYTVPPKGMVFEPNVAVTFCKFYENYHDRNYQGRDYQRIAEYIHENKAKFFTTWEYLLKPHISEWAFPCMVPRVHAQDVQRLSEIGDFMGGTNQYLYMQAYSGEKPGGPAQVSPVLDFMNLYWRMKLYDDFDFDIESGLAEYYETFFGPGAEGMQRFYTAMENRWMNLGGGQSSRAWWGKLGTAEFMEEITGYIQQARQATREGTLYRKRVDLIDAGILQHMVKARAKYADSAMSQFSSIATAAVARTTSRISPEGKFNDAIWADSLPFEIQKTIQNEPVPQKTIFHLAYDADYLYIKARCLEPDVSKIKASIKDKDIGGFSDDSIELFFDPSGKGETYYQLCINTLGAVYDALENPSAIGATATISWDSQIKVETSVGDDYWEMRAALPLASLGDNIPKPGSTWRFNLCRNRFTESGTPPFSAWSPTFGGFRQPDRFGLITFNSPEDGGRVLWHCDFDSDAFTTESGHSPLIGTDGWYENLSYANRGWDKSWKVVERDGNRLAVGDLNKTNPSDIVPMHGLQVFPGTFSVEVDYHRLGLQDQPTLIVSDINGVTLACMYAWPKRGDLVAINQPKDGLGRQNFANEQHQLGQFTDAGKWFGLKLVIDTVQEHVIGYVRAGSGEWVRLNKTPLQYYDSQAQGNQLFVGFGSYKLKTADQNILEMDNIRVVQLSYEK